MGLEVPNLRDRRLVRTATTGEKKIKGFLPKLANRVLAQKVKRELNEYWELKKT